MFFDFLGVTIEGIMRAIQGSNDNGKAFVGRNAIIQVIALLNEVNIIFCDLTVYNIFDF
jgi:hypothetical protein